jgi:hypothetical protein
VRKRIGIWAVMVLLVLSVFAAIGASQVFAVAGAAGVQYYSAPVVFNPNLPGYDTPSGLKGQAGINYYSSPVVFNPNLPGYSSIG